MEYAGSVGVPAFAGTTVGRTAGAAGQSRRKAPCGLFSNSTPLDTILGAPIGRRQHEGAHQRVRQDRRGRAGAGVAGGRVRAGQHGRDAPDAHGGGADRRAGVRRDGGAGDAGRPREDAAPRGARRPAGPPRPAGAHGGAGGPRHRDHRRVGGQPLPLRGDGQQGGRRGPGRAGEHRHRRADDAAGRGQEPPRG